MISIEIRPANGWEDCLQCEALEKTIWWTPDGSDAVPASLLITVQKNGGLLLGAYEGSKMVGFVFGFVGVEGEGEAHHFKHCSHMLGVLPEYRGLGLGLELKKKQRDYLITQDLDLATWTYDPLQSVNAILNISRLGGVVRRYLRDAYGEMRDALNVGVASDRFEVEWWLKSRRVRDKLQRTKNHLPTKFTNAQSLYQIKFEDNDLPRVISESSLESGIAVSRSPQILMQ